jgi:epoxyqueuosine reductase QueG
MSSDSEVEPDGLLAELKKASKEFMSGADNTIELSTGVSVPCFDMPIMGVAAGEDPIWRAYKTNIIGPYHFTPLEAFQMAYPDEPVTASQLSVLSWVLPQTADTREEQRKQTYITGERWARSRSIGEGKVNEGMRRYLIAYLAQKGIPAAGPQILPQWYRLRASEGHEYSSAWSERHAAHAAGLGTFGLCDGLITPAGKAHRVGSIVLKHPLPVTPRPYRSYNEYCLFFTSGKCRACVKRCPVGALSEKGHDKLLCYNYLWEKSHPYVKETWHFNGYGCGLCQVGVPCEYRIPRAAAIPG